MLVCSSQHVWVGCEHLQFFRCFGQSGAFWVGVWWVWWLKHKLSYEALVNFLAFSVQCGRWVWQYFFEGWWGRKEKEEEAVTKAWGVKMAVTVKDLSVPLCFGKDFTTWRAMVPWGAVEKRMCLSVCMELLFGCKLWPGSIPSRLDTEIGFWVWNLSYQLCCTLGP